MSDIKIPTHSQATSTDQGSNDDLTWVDSGDISWFYKKRATDSQRIPLILYGVSKAKAIIAIIVLRTI